MKFDETERVLRTFRASYYMDISTATAQVWYTHLMDFDYSIVNAAAMDYIANERKAPTIADIVEKCRAIIKARRESAYQEPDTNTKTVKCPFCKDRGLVMYESPTGVLIGRPCTSCPAGRKRYPWEFLTEEQKQIYRESEAKKGRVVPKPHVASDEFYAEYTGIKK